MRQILLLFFLFAVVASGNTGDVGIGGNIPQPNKPPGYGQKCKTNKDCPIGYVCYMGKCINVYSTVVSFARMTTEGMEELKLLMAPLVAAEELEGLMLYLSPSEQGRIIELARNGEEKLQNILDLLQFIREIAWRKEKSRAEFRERVDKFEKAFKDYLKAFDELHAELDAFEQEIDEMEQLRKSDIHGHRGAVSRAEEPKKSFGCAL